MKRFVQIVVLGLAVLQAQSNALTIRMPTFEGVVQQSDMIAVVSIYRGETTGKHDPDGLIDLTAFCATVESIMLEGDGIAEGNSLCFESSKALKVGSNYLVFLLVDDSEQAEQVQESYLALLALEVVDPNPHHEFRAIRWEALQHPIIPGLVEKVAIVEYQDEEGVDAQRSIPVYTYFPLSEIENVVRGHLVRDE